MLPPDDRLRILFVHAAYRMAERFSARGTGIAHAQVGSPEALAAEVGSADVVCVSMAWRNPVLASAPKLRFVQSISAGIDQYDQAAFQAAGVRLASGAGVNANAVAEHALALMLSLQRLIHTSRDHQAAKHWRPMISDIGSREAELAGKTLITVGMGRIGSRLTRFAKALDMHVIGVRRSPADGAAGADAIVAASDLHAVLPRADVVVLACPLTPDTENLIDARALAAMKPGAHLINVARGKVVDETALIAALQSGTLTAAGLDVTRDEPLPPTSPLWSMPNVLLTPHVAGETRAYEDNVIDILLDNIRRLQTGETTLRNGVV